MVFFNVHLDKHAFILPPASYCSTRNVPEIVTGNIIESIFHIYMGKAFYGTVILSYL